jgi:hypothetical protein
MAVVPLNVSGELRLSGPVKFNGKTTGAEVWQLGLTRFNSGSSGELNRVILMIADVDAVIVEFGEPTVTVPLTGCTGTNWSVASAGTPSTVNRAVNFGMLTFPDRAPVVRSTLPLNVARDGRLTFCLSLARERCPDTVQFVNGTTVSADAADAPPNAHTATAAATTRNRRADRGMRPDLLLDAAGPDDPAPPVPAVQHYTVTLQM